MDADEPTKRPDQGDEMNDHENHVPGESDDTINCVECVNEAEQADEDRWS